MQMPEIVAGTLATGGALVADPWVAVADADAVVAAPVSVPLLATRALWTEASEALLARGAPVGVLLEPGDDPAAIAADLPRLALIAVRFPTFTDGRGYSIARLLRERFGWAGPLRAVGDVLRDQLFYLARCGFDEFALAHPERAQEALGAFRDFGEAYQTAVDRRVPLFARRTAEAAA